MKGRSYLSVAAAVALVAATGASIAGDSGQSVRYRGDQTARTVCMSIVRDDVDSLDRALSRGGEYYASRRIHETYECNRLPLDEFAFTQNAEAVSAYLAPMFGPGRVTIEQVTSIQE